MGEVKFCRHCRERSANRPRRLCFRCYYNKEIRKQYPSIDKYGAWADDREPTLEELDAMIAEQLPTMPPWEKGDF